MINILIIAIIILIFSFIIGLILTGNDNRITDEERASMTDDVKVLFEDMIDEDNNSNQEIDKNKEKSLSDSKKDNIKIDDEII